MYCKNCGKEIGDSRYCPYCGSVQEDDLSRLEERYGGAKDSAYGAESYYSGGTGYGAAERLREIFRDTKFLVITVLMTVNAVAAVFGGSITINNRTFSVNLIAVFPILFCIGLWLCWAEGRKQTGNFSTTGLAMISGTAKAQWIVVWVGAILLLVFGILFIVAAPSVISNFPNDIWKLIPGDFYNDIPGMEDFNIFGIPGAVGVAKYYYEGAANAVAIGLGIVMVLVAVVMVILNIFFYKKLHMRERKDGQAGGSLRCSGKELAHSVGSVQLPRGSGRGEQSCELPGVRGQSVRRTCRGVRVDNDKELSDRQQLLIRFRKE